MYENKRNIFQVAILHHCENVFNLIYQMSEYKQIVTEMVDSYMNSMLHLVGKLAPHDKLNLVPGAALQMRRELQWFKEVEKLVNPYFKEFRNNNGEIPSTIFTREHKNLVAQGEKWMKDTGNSCTIVATLIATIGFAAAITVPGGNDGTSALTVFSKEKVFIVFIVSDAISIFTSTTSLLMFLSILTSHYAEEVDNRPCYLFLSITTMIVAFSSILYLVFGHNRAWILIPVTGLACLPITSFVSLVFPLLVDLISSTYGHGIFGTQSDRLFYYLASTTR
ncbi:hypothetical protein HYC85_003607 [Camellia sinensis]|uniref:PGG domain-containing protein n=1 Tax=Camellia sinensis TaxID=4442 RepID=A0A7J7HU61_CAMSI|nr:hypothetical protein HYC85_003607 [Camellia sinensis]